MEFIFYSEFGETLQLASYLLHVKKHDVVMYIKDKEAQSIGKGIVPHVQNWYDYIGKQRIWVFDSCSFGRLQDWLRQQGEAVFGGCEAGDELENNRQMNQEWFKELGFKQPFSQNFRSIADSKKFVEKQAEKNPEKRWILKQNGDAPKSINHMGKFSGSIDLLFHLGELEKSWNPQQYGEFDCDLMEVVEGLEVAASAFFDGTDFLRNEDGRIAGFLNFEEKKEADGGLGETCGEMGTTFIGVDDSHPLFHSIIGKPGIIEKLSGIGFHGVFDINCIVGDSPKQITALEPTMRFGIPATSYEMIEGMVTNPGEVIAACAMGTALPKGLRIHYGVGMVMCVVAKPFPCEMDVEDQATSLGERLWILNPKDGEPAEGDEFTEKQREHIHLYNFERAEAKEGESTCYKVVTKNGYMLTCTHKGESIKSVRKQLITYIKDNLYLSGMKYRTDIGSRIEEYEEDLI